MTTTAFQSNPLVKFRTPDKIKARTGESHFKTTREQVENDTEGLSSFYNGEFRYKPDPTLEIELATWDDDPDNTKSYAMYLKMTGRDGWSVAMAKDWDISDRLQLAWRADEGGRLTLGGKTKKTLVLMWRNGELHDVAQKRRLRASDEVQKSAEQKQAELAEAVAQLGGSIKVTLTDDDGSDDASPDALPARSKKKVRA